MLHWSEVDLPDLNGDTVVITGANSGIGFETSQMLAARGAHVVLACRSEERAEEAMTEIRDHFPQASLEFMALDLASLTSIRAFARALGERHESLDRLINNAGLMAIPHRTTEDGFEMQFGVNHLGHFALTNLVLPLLEAATDARVVTVSSNAHNFGKIDWDNLNAEKSYSKWGAYGQAKLANLLFAYELQRKLEDAGASTVSMACHPGYAATDLQAKGPQMEGSSLMESLMNLGNKLLAQSAHDGALPTLRAAYDPSLHGGEYVGPEGFLRTAGAPIMQKSSRASYNRQDAERLWKVSEELTGTAFPLDAATA